MSVADTDHKIESAWRVILMFTLRHHTKLPKPNQVIRRQSKCRRTMKQRLQRVIQQALMIPCTVKVMTKRARRNDSQSYSEHPLVLYPAQELIRKQKERHCDGLIGTMNWNTFKSALTIPNEILQKPKVDLLSCGILLCSFWNQQIEVQ